MTNDSQKIDNNLLGEFKSLTEKTSANEKCQTVGIDIGTVSAGVLTPSRISATNPMPVTGTVTGPITASSTPSGNNVTGQKVGSYQRGLDTNARVFDAKIGVTYTATSGTTTSLAATGLGSAAKVGDKIRFLTGTLVDEVAFVESVTPTTTVGFSQTLSTAPIAGDTFELVRPITAAVVRNNPVFPAAGFDFLSVGGFDSTDGIHRALPLTSVGTAVNVGGTVSVNQINTLSDNTSNPGVIRVGAFGMAYDGATWDRMRGDSTDGLLVNLGANNDVTVTSGTVAATQSGTWSTRTLDGSGNSLASATGAPGASDRGLVDRSINYAWDSSGSANFRIEGNPLYGTQYVTCLTPTGQGYAAGNGASGTTVARVTIANDSTGILAGVTTVGAVTAITNVVHVDDNSGSLTVDGTVALTTGSATIGAVTFATPTQGGGPSQTYYASLTNTGTTSLSSARKITGYNFGNASTTATAFVRIYDKSSAATGSDTPIRKIVLAPGADAHINLGVSPLLVANGISIRATTVVTDSNTTSPTANEVFGDIEYV